jgi:hypothetical protein
MNYARRSRIATMLGKLQDLHAEAEALRDEEQEAFDNMPESLQGSERGQASEDAAAVLGDAAADLESVISALEGIE